MVTDGVGPAVYVLALVNLSINRFLLAALSASLPRVVDGPLLLTANSLTPTLGAAAAGVGGASGFVLGLVLPDGPRQGRGRAAASPPSSWRPRRALATRLGKDRLGPDERADARADARRARHPGARPRRRRPVPRRATDARPARSGSWRRTGSCYGVTFIASILIARNLLSDPADAGAGLRTFGLVLAASAVGFVLAVVLTPVLSPRTGPHVWIVLCLVAGRGQPAAARGVRPARPRCSSPPARSGWPRRARRSPSTPSCSATPTTPSAAGRSRSTTSSTTPRSSGRRRSVPSRCPTPGYSRGLFLVLAVAYAGFAALYGSTSRRVSAVQPAEARLAS